MAVPNPQEKEQTSIRLKRQIKTDLANLSEATGRPQTLLIEEALQNYLDVQVWQVEGIKKAIESADRGELYTTGEVLEALERHHEKKA